jgi:hypothetical protein
MTFDATSAVPKPVETRCIASLHTHHKKYPQKNMRFKILNLYEPPAYDKTPKK